ncbi:hypothetical protein FNYG_15034 [Fusarium nygamai]|uniref:Uncharacterized protein n=1 Tax=Gibberella nygamai TaxID=42673 RepID=A0A2K0ULV0_GIBNY|nr:hypothetical protein FNYG_15034 [Fusarium nygamai]
MRPAKRALGSRCFEGTKRVVVDRELDVPIVGSRSCYVYERHIARKWIYNMAAKWRRSKRREVITDWDLLKSKTNIQNVSSSSDPRIIRSFKVIDDVLCGGQSSTLLRRLAYVRLMDLFSFLEGLISFERMSGRVIRERYYRDASIAIDIYMSAQEDTADPNGLRRQLRERRRVGKCWKDLSKPSPLLVLMYSEAAERIM